MLVGDVMFQSRISTPCSWSMDF